MTGALDADSRLHTDPELFRSAKDLSPAEAGAIVVGHDGSPSAERSAEMALDLASALNAPVVLVRAWSIDRLPPGGLMQEGFVSSFDEVGIKVSDALREETGALCARFPKVQVECRSALGQPAEALIAIALNARMLVVGSRGRGGFAALTLGSVSEQCVHHAHCPVLVVRS